MKTNSRLRYFIYLSILIVGCTTGKNALQKGNYDASIIKAVNRLQNSAQNKEAIQVLTTAYPLALAQHLRNIEEYKMAADVLRWETIVYEYQQLNQLADEINSCPSCLLLVPNPQKFVAELNDSKYKAAEVRYTIAAKLLSEGDKLSARKAYQNFEKTLSLYPNFKDTKKKIDEAYWAAVLKVLVKPVSINSSYYQLSNQYFQQQIDEYLYNYRYNKFVIFYDEQQADQQNIIPDQVIQLRFDDFVVGQTYVKERVEKLKKDSIKIGETRTKQPIYGTVKATISVFEKRISSSGLLAMTVVDWSSRKVLRQRNLTGTYVWEDQWASYKGDERALNNQQLAISKRKETRPPEPNVLFVELTKPIYSQLVNEIGSYYNGY